MSLLTACGGKDKDKGSAGKEQTVKDGGDLGGTAVNQTKDAGKDFTVTVLSIVSMDSKFVKPEAGNKFVFVKVAVKNNSDEEKNVSSVVNFNHFVDGKQGELDVDAGSALLEYEADTLNGEVPAGETFVGYYFFEAPVNSKSLELTFKPGLMPRGDMISFTMDIPKTR